MVRAEKLQALINSLADPDGRSAAADSLARALGAEAMVILLMDTAVGALVPAPGLLSTLPGGPTWRAFLASCGRPGEIATEVAFPTLSDIRPVRAYASDTGAVVALIGGTPTVTAIELHDHLALFLQLLGTEQSALAAEGVAAAAALAHRQAAAVAAVLEQARGRLAQQSAQLQAALHESSRLNAELRGLATTLEARVAEEIAERMVAEEKLRQAQKMEAVGQLTGGVAHDFNNLLTVIIGGIDTIKRSKPGDEVRIQRAADMALQGAQRAAGLTSRLLAFSRRQPLAPQPSDLNLLMRNTTELLHRTLGETVELEGVLAPRLWTVDVDPNQLESAILNLALNARDAMPEGGRLTIETANTALDDGYASVDAEVIPGQYVMVSVSDTGSGMDKETLGKVFEPFFTTKEVGKGTGLGLSMIYGFVKQSGGHVTIYSEPGEGTSVKLYFPRYMGKHSSDHGPPAPLAPRGQGEEVILVVEDNPDVRAYSVMVLTELGYSVLEAHDVDAALQVLERPCKIDLLFTDVVLPGRSGRVLADLAQVKRPGLRVLFTTGYSRNAIVHQGRLDAGVELIGKPFTFEQLAARVRDVLDARTEH